MSENELVERWLEATGALFGVDEFRYGSLRLSKLGRNQIRIIFTNMLGERLEFWVSRAELRPESELPTLAQLSGSIPDFTGGLMSEDYVRRMRDEDDRG